MFTINRQPYRRKAVYLQQNHLINPIVDIFLYPSDITLVLPPHSPTSPSPLESISTEINSDWLRGPLTFNSMFFIIHFREKYYKQNMKNTLWENVFVCKNFLSTVNKTSCIENISFLRGSKENAKAPPILEIEQNAWFQIGFSTTQSVGNYPESSFTFQKKLKKNLRTLHI